MSPTPRAATLAGIVAVLAFALPVPPVIWLAALVAILGAAAADVWLASTPPAIERTAASAVVRGVASALTVVAKAPVRSGRAGPAVRYRVRQPAPPEVAIEPSESEDRLDATVVAGIRGRHVLPAVAVRATGPLGLGRRDFTVGGTAELLSFPDLPGARRMAEVRRRGTPDRGEGRVRATLGLGTEFEAVREYAPDDDVRRINWRATSRVGRPMTNQYRVERDREVLFVVDAGRLMAAPIGEATRLDIALDTLAAVAVAAEEAGDRIGGMVFSDSVQREVAPRRRGAEGLVLALADTEASDVDSDYGLAFHYAAAHKRALVLVLTDLLDDSAGRTLAEAVPALTRRHAVLIASATDPDIGRLLTTEPKRDIDVLSMSVALDVLAARGRAITAIRGAGAVVVDASPDRLPSTCVNAYLTLKRRARL